MTIGLFSHAAAVVAYLLLTALLVTAWRGRLLGLFAVAAMVATLVWAGVGIAISSGFPLPERLPASVEWVRNGAWLLFLANVLDSDGGDRTQRVWTWRALAVILVAGLLTMIIPMVASGPQAAGFSVASIVSLGWIGQAIVGLVLIEQIYRNRDEKGREQIKHLCLGLGAVLAYDLFFYSDALLLQRIDPHLWEARGLIHAVVVPLLAVSAARNPKWSLSVHVSRDVVFHSATLTGAGVYLLAMAAVGYYIRYIGGAWGLALQTVFLFAAGLILLLLLFSDKLRARARIFLSEHFFSFKYDYRAEWLGFTAALSCRGEDLPKTIVSALAGLVKSPGGMLWLKSDQNVFELAQCVEMPCDEQGIQPSDHPMVRFMAHSGWTVDLDEYRTDPGLYGDFEEPGWLARLDTAWLIIPLLFREELCGFVVLARSLVRGGIDWEDRSLLKTAGRQAASHVAQYLADRALMRVRQFEAFHQLSAYVAHDLKNLLAQQSLLLANAERHRDNPAFLDDVIKTVASSVERMNRLMVQLRNGARGNEPTRLSLDQVLGEALARQARRKPRPRVSEWCEGVYIMADRERLLTVFGHIIQNAQDATRPDGSVVVRLSRDGAHAVVEIEDDGVGMSPKFIRERLFRPFDSTKGLTGMGVGAFETRELIRLLGGDLRVTSQPGMGSVFHIALPCAAPLEGERPVSPMGSAGKDDMSTGSQVMT